MNIFRFMSIVAFAAISTCANAQFVNSGKTSKSSSSSSYSPVIKENGWKELYLQIDPVSMGNAFSLSGTGYAVGFNKAVSVMKDQPVYLLIGAGLQYSKYSLECEIECDGNNSYFGQGKTPIIKQESSVSFFDINVPVSVMYDYSINEKFSVSPYLGLKIRAGISGTEKDEYEFMNFSSYGLEEVKKWYQNSSRNIYDKGGKDDKDYMYNDYMYGNDDMYDDDDMDDTFNRFLIGWQIGANINYDKYFLGVSYGTYFNKVCTGGTWKQTSITLGMKF